MEQATQERINQMHQDNKTRNLVVSVIMIVIVSAIFGALLGSYITMRTVTKSFDVGNVHVCNAQEIDYQKAMSDIAIEKAKYQNCAASAGVPSFNLTLQNPS